MRKSSHVVDPCISFEKLKAFGESDDSLVWSKSYLSNRLLCTWVDHSASNLLDP